MLTLTRNANHLNPISKLKLGNRVLNLGAKVEIFHVFAFCLTVLVNDNDLLDYPLSYQ
jgi:hypothetical protein